MGRVRFMETQMLRSTLKKLDKLNYLKTCDKKVDIKFELGAILKHFDNEVPINFKNIKGYDMPVVGGIYGNRQIFYDLMGLNKDNRIFEFMNAIANPKPIRIVDNGPIKENIITRNIDIQRMFPIPTSHEKDSSSFITAGMLIVKDPESGDTHMAVRRFQINDKNIISALISGASPHLREAFRKSEEKNKPLECAVVLGYDAEYLIASQISSSKYGLDKYKVYSSLKGEPLELVKCHSVDIEVPAYCEIVLEGELVPNKREIEGPFGELMGYYGEVAPNPIMEVKTVMHRNNPIFQHAFPCREEHLANGLIREVEIYSSLTGIVDVKDVNVTVGGGCRLHAIVSINKKNEGDGKSAIISTLGSSKDVKHVVIVDDDVDIYSYKDVEFALASRVQASQDVVIIPNALGSGLEASHVHRGLTDKMGIDATKPLGEKSELYERAIVPGYEDIDIEKYF
jgi:2,5-furandicarboxylate decarboxylase 1